MQQSISLQGCAPNAWPLDHERVAAAARLGVEIRYGGPFGALDAVQPRWHGIRVAGWAIDPDTAAPTMVMVNVDGARSGQGSAGLRYDVAWAHPGYGPGHGFDAVVRAAPGSHRVCVDALNVVGRGTTERLGCRTVVVGSPFGSVDGVATGPHVVRVRGWAIDPDTTGPAVVHVYVDGAGHAITARRSRPDLAAAFSGAGAAHGYIALVDAHGTALLADGARPDIANAYPLYGANHGFDQVVAAPPGSRQVCAYALDGPGPGTTTALGCRPL
jgi:hypothetical protein